jgi:dTMP kinase
MGILGYSERAPRRAPWIAIEGCDGAGKSIQTELLTKRLLRMGFTVWQTRLPGATNFGTKVRELIKEAEHVSPIAQQMLMAADHAEFSRIRAEKVAAMNWVVTDRSFLSSLVYGPWDMATWLTLNDIICGGVLPNLTIVLDARPETLLERVNGQPRSDAIDWYDTGDWDLYDKRRRIYTAFADSNTKRAIVVTTENRTIEEISDEIFSEVKERLI